LKISGEIEPIPDVVASREKLEVPYPTRPVELYVEILSADDQLKKVFQKAGHYLAWGVGCLWIIDPDARTAWVVSREFPGGLWVHPDGALAAGEDTVIPLPEIFDEVDRLI
jgi:Uma2 family endonuclease